MSNGFCNIGAIFFAGVLVGIVLFGVGVFGYNYMEDQKYALEKNKIMAMDDSELVGTFLPDLSARFEQQASGWATDFITDLFREIEKEVAKGIRDSIDRGAGVWILASD